jgi:hypothetical protein
LTIPKRKEVKKAMSKIKTRMGDAALVEITESELRSDLEEGTKDAAQRGKIPPLSPDELNHLFDIYSSPARVVGVEPGHEVVFTYDSTCGEINRTLIPVTGSSPPDVRAAAGSGHDRT